MTFWLLKSEPDAYSWARLKKEKMTLWDGVRNYQARNNLKSMKKGDFAFFYHSGDDKSIQGITEITREFYPDPTASTGDWVVVDVTFIRDLKRPVTLQEIKSNPFFKDFILIKHSRLSVMPVEKKYWDEIFKMSEQ